MLHISVFLIFTTVLFAFCGIFNIIFQDKMLILDRVHKIKNINMRKASTEEFKFSFFERIIQPLYQFLMNILKSLTTTNKMGYLSRQLEQAGLLKNLTVEQYLFRKIISTLSISLLIAVLIDLRQSNTSKSVLFAMLFAFLIFFIYRFNLLKKITKRRENIVKQLPYTLDLIIVSVEAGLSFDGAIAHVVQTIKGDLSEEFAKALKEMRMGIQRKQALRNMSERCDIKQLSMLLTSIIQADELGVSLGNVLRIESTQLREQRKQAAREKAMKAPVKMLFPLIFFIFPAIFVIILGPSLIRIFEVFGVSGK